MPRRKPPPKPRPQADEIPASAAQRYHQARQAARRGVGRPPNQRNLPLDVIKTALRASRGGVLTAAERLGVSRAALYYRISTNPELQKLQSELMEEQIDEHEDALRHLALEELHPTAILSFLNAKARPRGWGRAENPNGVLSPGVGDTHYHVHLHGQTFGNLANLSDGDLDRLIAERRAALPAPDSEPELEMVDITPQAQDPDS
jgi:hypothetical protein